MLCLTSCVRKITELVFVVDTDLPRPLAEFRILFREPTGVDTSMVHPASALGEPPWTLSVRGAPDSSRTLVFVVFARHGDGATERQVQYRGRTQFVPGQRRIVPIFLSETCAGFVSEADQSCDPSANLCCARGTSCRSGRCEDEYIEPNSLPQFSETLAMSRLDGGVSRDSNSQGDARDLDTSRNDMGAFDAPRDASDDASVIDAADARVEVGSDAPVDASTTPRWNPGVASALMGRSFHAMAYDSLRHRVVLFGGYNGATQVNDTWEWDGTWSPITSNTTPPPPRHGHALVYDPQRQRVVLFGGSANSGRMNDTWEWDGTSWVQPPVLNAPPMRYHHALTYDSLHQRVVLFGGINDAQILNDTWELNGNIWSQVIGTGPSIRYSHALAYDNERDRVVLFGGWNGVTQYSDTWVLNGATWQEITGGTVPQARAYHAMTYDEQHRNVVLFGGQSRENFNDTWVWNGATWSPIAVSAPGAHDPLGVTLQGVLSRKGARVRQ